MFARIKPDFSDMERGTWYVPYYNAQSGSTQSPVTMPCGCKGPPLSPNSLTVGGIAFPGDVVAVTGNAGGSIPESADAWFPSAEGSAYLALFDRDLKTVSFSSFIPGTAGGVTANQPRIDARGSRVVIVGNAGSENAAGQPADPADHKVRFQTTKGAFQPAYGGGDRDGFVLVACLGSDGCGGPVPPLGSGAGAPPAAGSGAAGSSSVAGAAGGSAAAGASAGNSGGTSAGASGGRAGSTGSGGASGSSDDARAGASGCRVAGTGGDAAAALLALALGWIVRRGRKHGRRTNA
jgi:hypothetical protein